MQSWQPNFLQSKLLILMLLFEFKQIWRTYKDFHIRAVGNQVLLFNFELDTDADRVLLSEPWSFDRYLILFTRHIEGESNSSSLPGTINLWVQFHNLPFSTFDSGGSGKHRCNSWDFGRDGNFTLPCLTRPSPLRPM